MLKLFRPLINFSMIAFLGTLFYLTANFCQHQTDGFSLAFIHSEAPSNPSWNISCISQETREELKTVFSQKFRYLDSGGQCFAFVSESNKYVIKFFKHRHFRKPYIFFLQSPLPSVLELSRLQKLHRAHSKRNRDFTSYKLAYEELKEETGLIYIHLNQGTQLNQTLKIVDKIGIEHVIDLDKIEFVVQKRADHLYTSLNHLMASGDLIGARNALHVVLNLLVTRCKKGIFDEDPRIPHNLGLIDQKAMFIDVGRFIRDPQRCLPSVYKQDIKAIIDKRLRPWLETHHPQLIEVLNEEMDQL